jgi:hypothetical protein
LSTIRVFTPHLLIQFAIMSPAGPAPMMRTSTSESALRGAIVAVAGCCFTEWLGGKEKVRGTAKKEEDEQLARTGKNDLGNTTGREKYTKQK